MLRMLQESLRTENTRLQYELDALKQVVRNPQALQAATLHPKRDALLEVEVARLREELTLERTKCSHFEFSVQRLRAALDKALTS